MNVRNSYNNPYEKGGNMMNIGRTYQVESNNPYEKGNGSKYVMNMNQGNTMSLQERVVAFGQDKDENYFKQTLRKSYESNYNNNHNRVQSYNIITNLPNSNINNYYYPSSNNKSNSSSKNDYQNKNNNNKQEDYFKQGAQRYQNAKLNNSSDNNKQQYHQSQISKGEIITKNLKEYYNQNLSSIKEYAYQEDQNSKHRNHMEDNSVSVINFSNSSSNSLFCIFDGHGGDQVSKFLTENLPSSFSQLLPSQNIQSILSILFSKLDLTIKGSNYANTGSTACVVFITIENNRRALYCANIGDTRCIVVSKFGFKRLSYDHRATDQAERDRITKGGGVVFNGRVYGQLMLSRSFGDWALKSAGLICEPHVTRMEINADDRYVVIASDGIWDVCEDEDVYKIAQFPGVDNAKKYVKEIIRTAIENGAVDNMSCFVLKVN